MTKPTCHNRPDYQPTVIVQDGMEQQTCRDVAGNEITFYTPMLITIPDPMSKGCQQIRPPHGEAYLHGWDCAGCRHLPATGMHPCHTSEPGSCSWGSPSDPACTGCAKRS